jgi:hypothetical protein
LPRNTTSDTSDDPDPCDTPPARGLYPTSDLDLDAEVTCGADDATGPRPEPTPAGTWLATPAGIPPTRRSRLAAGMSVRGWAGLAALAAVSTGVLLGIHAPHHTAQHTGPRAVGTRTPATSPAASACAGLSGTVITNRSGDTATVPGVIAAFENAYYTRQAATALALLAPDAGIAPAALTDGIASIPPGTTHCVAITPLAENAATVHIAEIHPDRQRTDYLQVINTRPASGGGLLISRIQKQG